MIFTTNSKNTAINPLYTKISMPDIKTNAWINLCVNLETYFKTYFKGVIYKSIEQITILPFCNLRCLFLAKQPIEADTKLPGFFLEIESINKNLPIIGNNKTIKIPKVEQHIGFRAGSAHCRNKHSLSKRSLSKERYPNKKDNIKVVVNPLSLNNCKGLNIESKELHRVSSVQNKKNTNHNKLFSNKPDSVIQHNSKPMINNKIPGKPPLSKKITHKQPEEKHINAIVPSSTSDLLSDSIGGPQFNSFNFEESKGNDEEIADETEDLMKEEEFKYEFSGIAAL